MLIHKWTLVDVHYTIDDEAKGLHLIERKRLLKLGYTLEHEDDGSELYNYCDQFYKTNVYKQK